MFIPVLVNCYIMVFLYTLIFQHFSAAADIPLGTTVLVQELINVKIVGSKLLHNGCIRIDHICNSCQLGCQKIRLFVGTYQNYKVFPKFDKATVQKSNCTILKYD